MLRAENASVSTHSRLKAAAKTTVYYYYDGRVSTHSRLKAAAWVRPRCCRF